MTTKQQPKLFNNLGVERLAALTVQEIAERINGELLESDAAIDNAERLMQQQPALAEAVHAALASNPLPKVIYHQVMDYLEEVAREAANRLDPDTAQAIAKEADGLA